jgi:hypothetical protein
MMIDNSMTVKITQKAEESGLVYLSVLPATWDALEKYAEKHDYCEWFRRYTQPQWAAWLIFLLKAEPDLKELFPHGKWATIQRGII